MEQRRNVNHRYVNGPSNRSTYTGSSDRWDSYTEEQYSRNVQVSSRSNRNLCSGEQNSQNRRTGSQSSRNSNPRTGSQNGNNPNPRAGSQSSRDPNSRAGSRNSRNSRSGNAYSNRNIPNGSLGIREMDEQPHSMSDREKRRRREKARRIRRRRRILGMLLMCFLVITTAITVAAVGRRRHVEINLKVDDASILQDENLPEFTAEASCEDKKKDVVLDKKSKYIVQDLLDELNAGKGYTLQCDTDGTQEGEFSVKIKLSEELNDKLTSDWKDRVTLNMKKGTLTVKNKIGEWDGDKFKRWDGSYVTSEFVESEGDTYYFDEEGNKVTGDRQIGFYDCTFDEGGKMESRESRLDPDKPMMALTFDDGPGERTNELLDVLEKYNAHATFFMQGVNIPGHEAEVSRMLQIGCEVGNHSYDHPQLSSLDAAGIQKQIGDTNDLIKSACGKEATVLRPPFGDIDDNVKANVGLPMILWNIDTLDWKTLDTQSTINCVLNTADDGDIVLMHDIHSTSVDAALYLIPKLIEDGYQLVTVSEMAEARGITMENGAVYTDFNK